MENKEMVDVEIELEDYQLEFLKENNIDPSELFNKLIEKLKLEESIKRDSERLAELNNEIRELGNK
jgi:hypothetical protein